MVGSARVGGHEHVGGAYVPMAGFEWVSFGP